MSLHTIWTENNRRLILECGIYRIEILCNLKVIEFCPCCGEKIVIARVKNDS